jgi:tRNA-specific 2-thiouridylase
MPHQSQSHTSSKSIAVGLSGGVDSAVAAYLLKQAGYSVTAVYLECWNMPGCRAEQDRQDALKVALQLDMPFKVLDFKDEYRDKVMSYFVAEYQAGRTPNPDVLCNQVIKFGMFYDWAMEQGFDYIATGHYAQIGRDEQNKPLLLTSRDLHKDQTYFLHQVNQEQLEHILFPIGHLFKKEVRQLAHKIKLPIADKKDSVGICFVGEINLRDFLQEKLGKKPGKVVTPNGKIVGQHDGLWFYTIGQRKGFEPNTKAIKQNTDWTDNEGNIPPLYVIDKIQDKNQLVIGPKTATQKTDWEISQFHQISPQLDWVNLPLSVRIRHTGKLVKCKLKKLSNGKLRVSVETPVNGVAAGQFSVFYVELEEIKADTMTAYSKENNPKQYICLGGGVIE